MSKVREVLKPSDLKLSEVLDRVQKQSMKPNKANVLGLLKKLDDLNFNDCDPIALRKGAKIVDSLASARIHNPDEVLAKLARYDYALFCAANIGGQAQEVRLETLNTLYEALLGRSALVTSQTTEYVERGGKVIGFVDYEKLLLHAFEQKSFILLDKIACYVPDEYKVQAECLHQGIIRNILHCRLDKNDATNLIKFYKVKINDLTFAYSINDPEEVAKVGRFYRNNAGKLPPDIVPQSEGVLVTKATSFILNRILDCWELDPEKAKELLSCFVDLGLELNHPSIYDNALAIALSNISLVHSLELAEVLISAGANVNALLIGHNKFDTIASLAVILRSPEAVELLVKYGVDPSYGAKGNEELDLVEHIRWCMNTLLELGGKISGNEEVVDDSIKSAPQELALGDVEQITIEMSNLEIPENTSSGNVEILGGDASGNLPI